MRRVKRAVAGAIAAASCALAFASPALAEANTLANPKADLAPPVIPAGTSVSSAQSWLLGAITLRQQQVATLVSDVSNAASLTNSDASALSGLLSDAANGLNALATAVNNDTNLAQLRHDAATMVTGFHVYAVLTPQVNGIITADTDQVAITHVSRVEDGIAAAIATLGRGQAAAASKADKDLVSLVEDANNQLSGLSTSLLGLSLGVDLGTAQPVIENASQALGAVHDDLVAGHGDLRQIIGDLSAKNAHAMRARGL